MGKDRNKSWKGGVGDCVDPPGDRNRNRSRRGGNSLGIKPPQGKDRNKSWKGGVSGCVDPPGDRDRNRNTSWWGGDGLGVEPSGGRNNYSFCKLGMVINSTGWSETWEAIGLDRQRYPQG